MPGFKPKMGKASQQDQGLAGRGQEREVARPPLPLHRLPSEAVFAPTGGSGSTESWDYRLLFTRLLIKV